MAVVENAGISVDSSNRTDNSNDQPKSNQAGVRSSDQNFHGINGGSVSRKAQVNGNGVQDHHRVVANGGRGFELRRNGDSGGDEGFEMRDLEEMLSKLNPMAEEFVPPSLVNNHRQPVLFDGGHLGYINNFVMQTSSGIANGNIAARRRNSYTNGKRRMNNRTSLAQREEVIRRTVYVSDIDHQVTEEQLAALFVNCGQVVDCRVCGDPNSVLRFAFIEFTDEEGARNALSLAGTMLGYYPVRVLPSKTAIAPVNSTFLPRSEDEREMCARTIYCTNIDKKVTQADVKLFFESICGEVYRLRLLGDFHHSTRIAFVEFVMAESAIAALNCSGAVLGSLPIRVSPSKTPVRPRSPRPSMH
ncbi:polyadenylate-binding protein-interacting protein 11-like isoform X2 [Rhododendron vialii]|uniref:polyadenylate-binding protein-interacting protein 11-like isoform X2 n=1 Tax=Rhododendron vialii TaxID=182163 RepID=UPI00265E853E|nr:polyadenylate-binding protein-interacting protein 11-like isoform X2 [Rhododendron vialii]